MRKWNNGGNIKSRGRKARGIYIIKYDSSENLVERNNCKQMKRMIDLPNIQKKGKVQVLKLEKHRPDRRCL